MCKTVSQKNTKEEMKKEAKYSMFSSDVTHARQR